jgi:hypothetical protein
LCRLEKHTQENSGYEFRGCLYGYYDVYRLKILNGKNELSQLISISFHTRSERTKESTKTFGKVFDKRKVKESAIGLIIL